MAFIVLKKHDGSTSEMATPRPILTCAPTGEIAPYDREHATIYLRLLDAEEAGAAWRGVAEIVLGLGPDVDQDKARRIYGSHLARAHWLVEVGYKDLLTLPHDERRDEPNPMSR